MKTLKDAYLALKKIVPNSIDISNASPQGGVYLLFKGLNQININVDLVSFIILIQAKSLNDDNFSALSLVDSIRREFIKHDFLLADTGDISAQFKGFNGMLYSYEMSVSFKIFRDDI
ncbi:hypothetical protein [Campylobacter corcagiensis]|uniref:DUF3168 domain-containing protein n=1 Tax=Campylobacter corcagiensis TaxID=1448857 RepID=A0A7M1LF93_9BACT|nr:hypothetical protein [Campylobacter corcagiensis]QKF64564.1 hypothetical protein CCORG_0703 [Campylobacter corcagiensis]QOQ87262.1 hypothetical protein IMC76_08655 [Campylobacter corcagiensis]